jgi:dihydroneopterin aldolase
MTPTARIIVSGLEVFAYHGCTSQEKERGQRFVIDIELVYDASAAVADDDLRKAVDYDQLTAEVYDLATRERHDLIETLASRIGEHIIATTNALSVLVRVSKPEAPMRHEVEGVAVEMVFGADGR